MRGHSIVVLLLLVGLCQAAIGQARPQIDRSYLEVTPMKLSFGSVGGTKNIAIRSGGEWNIVKPNCDWCRANAIRDGVKVTVYPNKNSSSRSVTLIVKNGQRKKSIIITQSATPARSANNTDSQITSTLESQKDEDFSVSNSSLNFSYSSGVENITVFGSSDWGIYTFPDDWVHLSKEGNRLSVRVDQNNSDNARMDYFVLKSNDNKTCRINISQDKSTNFLSITPSQVSFTAEGGTQEFIVNSSQEWRVSVSPISWGNLERHGDKLILKVDKNNEDYRRSDYFEIQSEKGSARVSIFQENEENRISVSDTEVVFASSGGDRRLIVTSTKPWHVKVTTAPWVRMSMDGNVLTLKAEINTEESSRYDYVVLESGNKTCRVTISQQGAIRSLDVSKSFVSFSPRKSRETICVNCNAEWWISTPPASWVDYRVEGNSIVLIAERNKRNTIRSDYFEICSGSKTQRINLYQKEKKNSAIVEREEAFSCHFLNLQMGYNIASNELFAGGSYSYMASHIGFRMSAMYDFVNVETFLHRSEDWIVSIGPTFRWTKDVSSLDFQTYICPALVKGEIALDAGLRFSWITHNRLSLWDFTLGTVFEKDNIIPTVGLGVGLANSPIIGAGALLGIDFNRHTSIEVPHHFLECNLLIPRNNDDPKVGMTFAWIPNRFGTHITLYKTDETMLGCLGLDFRMLKKNRLLDWQLYSGVGTTLYSYQKQLSFDFGTRLNFENHRKFSWFDITVGGILFNGEVVPTIGCGLGLSTLVGGSALLLNSVK